MDIISSSEGSSGCESGWTMYLDDESNLSPNLNTNVVDHQSFRLKPSDHPNKFKLDDDDDFQEDDLSMVSDASSGPQHFPELYDIEDCHVTSTCSLHNRSSITAKKIKSKRSKKDKQDKGVLEKYPHQQYSYSNLDDTASSPAVHYSKMYANPSNNQASVEHFMGFSQSLSSATHFKENSAVCNHYAYWQSSHPKNTDSAEPSQLRLERKKVGMKQWQ